MRGRTRLAGVLATVALAAGMTLAATGTARADIIPPVAQWAEIYSPYLNGQGFSVCLDDPSGSTASGTVLQLYHCHGYASNGTPQRWVFIQPQDTNGNLIYDNGHPIYEIYSSAGGLCLTAPNLAVGTQLTLGTCNRATATGQIWWELPSVNSPAGPYFQIFPWPLDFTYNRCVSAANLSGGNGTRLMMEPCDPSNSARIFALG